METFQNVKFEAFSSRRESVSVVFDLTFVIDNGEKLSTRLYDKRDDLTSTFSIFHSFPATYHLALLMVSIFHAH